WSVNSNKKSKKYSKEAINLVINNLVLAVNKSDKRARVAMSRASNLAGKAICITKTTACHAISYPITSYFNILHGHACSLTLSSMLVHNSNIKKNDTLDERGTNYVKKTISDLTKILGVSNVYKAKEIIDNLIKNIGLENNLTNLGINKNGITEIINNVNLERMKNNPRKLNKKQLRDIFKNLR
ncbi:MAG: iron-containing alcohol dehydrogenase, partial [Patescibacteria group bacterium]